MENKPKQEIFEYEKNKKQELTSKIARIYWKFDDFFKKDIEYSNFSGNDFLVLDKQAVDNLNTSMSELEKMLDTKISECKEVIKKNVKKIGEKDWHGNITMYK